MKPIEKVSICVPIYKTEKYIEKCAISLFEQTYQNIEFIFIDDKTPDKSIDILQKLIQSYHKEKETKIITHQINRGLAAARNSGVAASTGDFIMHVDSDDYLEINTVELAIKKQKETNADIVSFGFITEFPKYKIESYPPPYSKGKELCKKLIKRECNTNLCGRLYRSSLYKDHDISAKEGTDNAEDYQVIPRLAYYANIVASLQIPLYHYNCLNPNSYCYNFSKIKQSQAEESTTILMNFFKDKPEFKDSTCIGWLNIHIEFTKKLTTKFSKKNKQRFIRNRIETLRVNKKYWKKISLRDRIILMISSYCIAYVYINLMRKLKLIIYKFTKQPI